MCMPMDGCEHHVGLLQEQVLLMSESLLKPLIIFSYMYVCMSVHMNAGALGGQRHQIS